MESFADFLNNFMKTNKLSQVSLGQILSVSQATIGKWRMGESVPNSVSLLKLAEYANVSLADLEDSIGIAEPSNTFSKNLKRLLQYNGLSQSEFAEKMNVSKVAVSKWLNGKAHPSPKMKLHVASFFNVDVNELTDKDFTLKKKIESKDSPLQKLELIRQEILSISQKAEESLKLINELSNVNIFLKE